MSHHSANGSFNSPTLPPPPPPSAAYIIHWIGSALVQIMACRLFQCQAIIYHLNECWVIVNWALGNKFQWKFNQYTKLFIHDNASENIVCKWRPLCPGGDELLSAQPLHVWFTRSNHCDSMSNLKSSRFLPLRLVKPIHPHCLCCIIIGFKKNCFNFIIKPVWVIMQTKKVKKC